MLTKLFWTVLGLDVLSSIVLWHYARSGTPGGAVLLFLVVLVAIAVMAAVFPLVRSDWMRVTVLVLMAIPSALLVFAAGASAFTSMRDERHFSGTAYFHGPALELAQALVRGEGGLVKQLVPAAGDLNKPYGDGVTLWQFAVQQAWGTDASIDVLRTLIAGGADPKRDTSAGSLQHALAKGPKLTRFLLEAGENPNLLDHEKRPLWWRTMDESADDPEHEVLRMMLDHGADFKLRAPDGRGPLAIAVAAQHWAAACMLIERGADWKQEKVGDWEVPQLLEWAILRRDDYGIPVPEMQRKMLAEMKGVPVAAVKNTVGPDDQRIPDLFNSMSLDKLDQARAGLERLAQHPHWVRRLEAFFEENNSERHRLAALLYSMKPEGLPERILERCWALVHEEVEWFDQNTRSNPKDAKGWRLREPGTLAMGLATAPGPVRERHRADFNAVRDRIEQCRKTTDPDAGKLPELKPW